MKRAVTYARESPSLAENELTVESQKESIIQRVEQDGNLLIEQYTDNGYAGDMLARPALDRLRDDASQRKFELVYIHDRDRLARKYALQELVIGELEELKIEVVFLLERKAETAEDRILQGVRGLFAEYEREKIKERTRRGRLHLAKKGMLVGHQSPYGYRYVRKAGEQDRWYEIAEEEAKVVRMIFEWVGNEGCSLLEVRRRLHDKKIKALKSGKTIWQNSTLSRLLRRTDYIGIAFYNKSLAVIPTKPRNNGYKRMKKTGRIFKAKSEWLPIQVPAIIDKDLFERTQNQLKRNAFFSKRNQKNEYLLSGLVFCGCGCSARMAGDGQGKYRYYRSTDRIRMFPEKRICTQLSVPIDKLEKVVWVKVTEMLNDPKQILAQLNIINKRKTSEQEKLKEKLLTIEKKLEKLTTEEARLVTAYRKEIFSLEQLNTQMKEINTQKNKIEDEKSETLSQPVQGDMPVDLKKIEYYCAIARKKLSTLVFEEKRELLRLLITKVIVCGKQVTIQGEFPIATINIDDSKSSLSSSGGVECSSSRSGGRHFIPFPSSILYRRASG